MRITLADIRRAVTGIVQPMRRGTFVSKTGLRARLKDVIPFGDHDAFVDAQPFGFNSNPVKGVLGYFQNLGGDRLAPIIITHQDNKRPTIAQGGTVLYSMSSGRTVVAKIELLPNGDITIGSSSASEPIILGGVFTTLYNGHKHLGNLGILTGPPLVPMSSSEVSARVFTEI